MAPAAEPTGQQAAHARVAAFAFFRRRARPNLAEALFWVAAIAAIFVLPQRALLLNEIAILALFALSLDLILGYAGIVSLGHAAFYGVGAYAAGLFAKHVFAEPVTGLLVAGVSAGAVGFATSFLVIRGSDLTRLMVTLGVCLLLHELAVRLAPVTGGSDGLLGIAMDPVLGLFAFDFLGFTAASYSLAVLFGLFVLARLVVGSPFGLSLRAVQGNVLRARALGIPPARRIVAVYTLSAVYAGVAGGLLAQTSQLVTPEALDFGRSADVLLALVIGGTGWLYGGLVGAALFSTLKSVLSLATPTYWLFWLGVILVALVLVGRERIAGSVARLVPKRSA